MTISAVSSVLERINEDYKADSFLRRQIICRALWFLLIPLETIALITQIARLIFIDYSSRPLLKLIDSKIKLPQRVSVWANKPDDDDTVLNIFMLTIGTTSTALTGLITPSGNYSIHASIFEMDKYVDDELQAKQNFYALKESASLKPQPVDIKRDPTPPPAQPPESAPTPPRDEKTPSPKDNSPSTHSFELLNKDADS